jgi:aldehyde dehydrogenase (NAD+)
MAQLTELNGEQRNLIDGRLVDSSSGATFENINPATEEVIGVCADGSREDMDAAIRAARRAFDETRWSSDPSFRARCLTQLYEALTGAKEEFRAIAVAEGGSPILLTYSVQTDASIEELTFWANLAGRYVYEHEMPASQFMGQPQRRFMRKEPSGVVGAITPWNFPLRLNLKKLGPALATGCTVVLKPAPDTPWSATNLGRIIVEHTDIPAGVVNIVASSDHLLGETLTTDPRVDVVSFTGSTATGRRIMQASAPTVKKVLLELGGKSAHIVLDDVAPSEVVPRAAAICAHAGQGCAHLTRLLLPRACYDEGIELAKAAFENVPYGDPATPSNLMGPLISKKQLERVLGYIDQGQREGARLITGGGVPSHLPRGFYVEPTIFADVDPDSTIAQEEIFGPVLAVIPFDGDDEAVRIANNSIYGLSGAVSSASEERALRVARQIRSGTLSVNGGQWIAADTPSGGYAQSGIGRENGVIGFEEFLETKVIALPGSPS